VSAVGAAAPPGAGGTLSWALAERPAEYDPLFASGSAARLVARQTHEPLVAELTRPFDKPRRLPGLAVSVRPSADATIWRLHLRAGVRFGDGAALDAQAVLANVERWRRAGAAAELLGDPLADAPRPDLVRFILPRPDPAFDRALASPKLAIVSPRAIAAAGGGPIARDAAGATGTGPFELREHAADEITLARNTDWWGAERGLGPGVDQLRFQIAPRSHERLELLRADSVQVAERLTPRQLDRVRREPLLTVVSGPTGGSIASARSVRGVPVGQAAPVLNSAWLTSID
jgi:peptide/nickel transport system substrate-binding protein